MKRILMLSGCILLMPVLFIGYSIYSMSKEEIYYGIVTEDRKIKKLVSEDKEVIYNYQVSKEIANVEKGDWMKITFAEHRGTVLNQERVSGDKIPYSIIKEIKQ
jgi:hypothetical protein